MSICVHQLETSKWRPTRDRLVPDTWKTRESRLRDNYQGTRHYHIVPAGQARQCEAVTSCNAKTYNCVRSLFNYFYPPTLSPKLPSTMPATCSDIIKIIFVSAILRLGVKADDRLSSSLLVCSHEACALLIFSASGCIP